jgi:hypothetical protein
MLSRPSPPSQKFHPSPQKSSVLLFFCLNSFLLLLFCLYYFSPSVLLSKYLLSFCLKIKICSFLVQSTTLK